MISIQDALTGIQDTKLNEYSFSEKREEYQQYNESLALGQYYEDEVEYSEYDEDYEPHGFITEKHKKILKKWLADKRNWSDSRLHGLGRGYEEGAKLVTVEGDGNCFFSSVSVNLTANKEDPTGTVAGHDELRQRCCDWIEKNRNSTVLQNIFKNRKKPFKTDAEFKEYVWKKRQTTGHFYTWSDGATSNATGGVLGR